MDDDRVSALRTQGEADARTSINLAGLVNTFEHSVHLRLKSLSSLVPIPQGREVTYGYSLDATPSTTRWVPVIPSCVLADTGAPSTHAVCRGTRGPDVGVSVDGRRDELDEGFGDGSGPEEEVMEDMDKVGGRGVTELDRVGCPGPGPGASGGGWSSYCTGGG